MGKVRKDKEGRPLRRGETYKKSQGLYRYSYTDPRGRRRDVYRKDLKTLREIEKQLQRDQLDGLDLYVAAKSDVNMVFDRYLSTKTELRKTTKSHYLYFYNHFVREGFGKKKIGSVKYSDVLMFYNALAEDDLSLNTIDNVDTLLHPTFQMAVRDDIIRNNPVDGAITEIKKRFKHKKTVRHSLTKEQTKAFLKHLDQPKYKRWEPLFKVMFGTGLRIGELIGLRWEDVDFEKNEISINHSISYGPDIDNGMKCAFHVSLPKTEAGIRKVPLLEKVRESLLALKSEQEENGFVSSFQVGAMNGFIFLNKNGRIHNPEGVNRAIKRIVADYNASEEIQAKRECREPIMVPMFSCHIARHTFCTRLCEVETNIKLIQYTMGHKDIQTTLDIYAEVTEDTLHVLFNNYGYDDII